MVFIPSASTLCQQVSEIPGRCIPLVVQRAGEWPRPPVSSTSGPARMPRSSWRKFTMVPHFLRYICLGGSVVPSPTDGAHGYRCPPGFRCPAGAHGKLPCEPGTFSPLPGSDTCLPCPGGTYCQKAATVEPITCPKGNKAPRPASGDRGTLGMTPVDGAPEGSVQAGPPSPSALLCPGTPQSTARPQSLPATSSPPVKWGYPC